MTDVLYIKGKPSLNNDLEMLYSLRTLEKHVKDLGRVFITGECPEFINKKKVIYTPAEDIGSPMINHWWKVDQTIRKTDIKKNFALMYDDIFITRNIKLAEYPFYQKGLLHQNQTGGDVYKESLINAAVWLMSNGKPTYDFELHIPCIYNKFKFKRLREIFEPRKDQYPGMAVRSIYGNLFETNRPYRKDIKIRTPYDGPADFIQEYDCFSVSDQAFQFKVLPWLKKNYKERSRYEK